MVTAHKLGSKQDQVSVLFTAETELAAYLSRNIAGQPCDEQIAKLVASSHRVIIQRQRGSEVSGGNVISILIKNIIAFLVFEVMERLLQKCSSVWTY